MTPQPPLEGKPTPCSRSLTDRRVALALVALAGNSAKRLRAVYKARNEPDA
jgi:hypothetical protein